MKLKIYYDNGLTGDKQIVINYNGHNRPFTEFNDVVMAVVNDILKNGYQDRLKKEAGEE